MKRNRLKGRRFINLVRCSTDQQADTSPEDQLRIGNDFGQENGMIHAGRDIVLEGVSGSIPGKRDDIDAVIELKVARDDFDLLVVQDVSRLSRFGDDHIGYIKHKLAMAGIEVVFVTGGTTGDPDTDAVMHSLNGYASKKWVKDLSFAVVRGQTSSLDGGKIPYSFTIPYGIDRLYLGPDNKPKHRIRNLADGSQQMLAADSETELAHYPKNPKKGANTHYRRQSDERIVLIPGALQRVAVVQQVYRRRLIDGWGCHRIAIELNDAGTPAPKGGLWNKRSLKVILENTIYSGTGVASRAATGIYHARGVDAKPMEMERDLQTMTTCRRMQAELRPEFEWRCVQYPTLENYLGEELAQRAKEYHAQILKKQAEKALRPKERRKPGGDKHVQSEYVLKGILHSKQGDNPMTGRLTGPKGDRRRYYAVYHGNTKPTTGSILSRSIPAEPLERAVLAAVREVFLDRESLQQAVKEQVALQEKTRDNDLDNITPLIRERDEVAQRLKEALLLGTAARKLLQKDIDQWDARLNHLDSRIAAAQATSPKPQYDADAVLAAVTRSVEKMTDSLSNAAPMAIRQLLRCLVRRLVVDLETRDVEMELALPETIADRLCLDSTSYTTRDNETQWPIELKIADLQCTHSKQSRFKPACYVCSRKAA